MTITPSRSRPTGRSASLHFRNVTINYCLIYVFMSTRSSCPSLSRHGNQESSIKTSRNTKIIIPAISYECYFYVTSWIVNKPYASTPWLRFFNEGLRGYLSTIQHCGAAPLGRRRTTTNHAGPGQATHPRSLASGRNDELRPGATQLEEPQTSWRWEHSTFHLFHLPKWSFSLKKK